MPQTTHLQEELLDFIGQTAAFGVTGDEVYIHLHDGDPEIGFDAYNAWGGNYTPQALTFGAASTSGADTTITAASVSNPFLSSGTTATFTKTGLSHFSLHHCAAAANVASANMFFSAALTGGSVDISSGDTITLTQPVLQMTH